VPGPDEYSPDSVPLGTAAPQSTMDIQTWIISPLSRVGIFSLTRECALRRAPRKSQL
jgi:hypothetical protein